VNLVFNFLDHFEEIFASLASGDDYYIDVLEHKLWNRDANGRQFVIAPGEMKQTVRQLTAGLDVKATFEEIPRKARLTFPDDYKNEVAIINRDELRARTDWLKQCIAIALEEKLGSDEARMLSRAVTEIHEAGLDRDRRTSRDHDYGGCPGVC
jgi:hypothetical protein